MHPLKPAEKAGENQADLNTPMPLEIPKELSFRLYCGMGDDDKDYSFRGLVKRSTNRGGRQLLKDDILWKANLRYIFTPDLLGGLKRDSLIVYWKGKPVGMQNFSVTPDGKVAYGEGIFVHEGYRKHGIAVVIREVFYIGKDEETNRSGVIPPYKGPQGLAEREVREFKDAVTGLERYPDSKIRSYGIDLTKFKPTYDTTKTVIL